jgi:hypothetical protein
MPAWPIVAATNVVVVPSSFVALFTSALTCNSTCSTAPWKYCAANQVGVTPSSVAVSTSALACMSIFSTWTWPFPAAIKTGATPRFLALSTSAFVRTHEHPQRVGVAIRSRPQSGHCADVVSRTPEERSSVVVGHCLIHVYRGLHEQHLQHFGVATHRRHERGFC